MRIKAVIVPIAALAVALGTFAAEAAQRDRGTTDQENDKARAQARRPRPGAQSRQRDNQEERSRGSEQSAQNDERKDRGNGARSQGRERAEDSGQPRDRAVDRGRSAEERNDRRASITAERNQRDNDRNSRDRGRDSGSAERRYGDDRAVPRDSVRNEARNRDSSRNDSARRDTYRNDSHRNDRSRRDTYRRDTYNTYRYDTPRYRSRYSSPRRYYGSGGHLSLYFGWGSGYRYGSPYSGRVYGSRGRVSDYESYRYYGDVRLHVKPREAAVYVDGYYAGIVDDFDGFFQRLTLEVGPHELEIEAPGLESQFFDIYVDPNRTVDVRGDLWR